MKKLSGPLAKEVTHKFLKETMPPVSFSLLPAGFNLHNTMMEKTYGWNLRLKETSKNGQTK